MTASDQIRKAARRCLRHDCYGRPDRKSVKAVARGLLAAMEYIEFMHHNERDIALEEVARVIGEEKDER